MAVAMVAMLAFGGTYAYFTAEVGKVAEGSATAGKIALSTTGSTAAAEATVAVLPGQSIFASPMAVKIVDNSTRASYIVIDITITVNGGAIADNSELFTISGLDELDGVNTVSGIAEPGRTDYAIKTTETLNQAGDAYDVTGGNLNLAINILLNAEKVGNDYQEATFTVVVNVNSIQAHDFANHNTAWTAFSSTNNGVVA